MTTPIAANVRRLCWLVRIVAVLLLVSVLFLYLGTWLFPEWTLWDQHWARMARIGGLPTSAARTLAGSDRFLIGAVCLPYLACLAMGFRHLGLMLRGFERGEFFERATVGHLRSFAGFLLLAKAFSLFALHVRVGMFLSLALPGQRRALFDLSSDDLALLLLCALIFLIAHLMEEGGRLAEENRSFL